MTPPGRTHPDYRHGLLVHDTDEDLVEGTRAFVGHGLASGGQVLVHGTKDRVALMREVLGAHPRLEYGFDEELYLEPTRTLFAYQRRLAERQEPTAFWVTGTVPLGRDSAAQAAWNRYESALNEALAAYPWRALCTYDTRTRPAAVIAAARATHSTVGVDLSSRTCPEYVDPAAFLASPLAEVPGPPTSVPSAATVIAHLDHLAEARHLLKTTSRSASALSQQKIEQFLTAVHEVAVNGLAHGDPPVHLSWWAEVASLACVVEDSGPGALDPLTGFRHPDAWGPTGLWMARQMVDDLFISNSPTGGCRVLLTRRANGAPDELPP
jgi:anti-sigma regulatory factor (Ser/Thr protein kinase)